MSGTYYIWQNSQAWPIGDDSGVIGELSAKVDEKADLSSVHSDYIEDASGYKIEASLSCRVKDFTLPWSLTGNSHSYSLQYDSNSRKWTYVETDAQKIELSYETINDSDIVLWELDFYVWDGMMSEWHFDAGYTTTADEEVTELYLNNEFWHATRSIIGTDKLATESYVDSHIGNINAVLDVINGEVI